MAISLNGVFAALALALGYLLGSIPFGLLLTRLAGTADLRSVGSGNIGATNVLRTGRKDLAAATLVLDALKATLACLLAVALFHDEAAGLAGAAGAFFGHLYPVWLRFRGGKGVATFVGGLIGAFWPAAIAFALVWLAIAAATRYSSAAALAASAAAPLVAQAMGRSDVATVFGALALLLWIKHGANIERLIAGTETKIGGKG
jgi:glycerol-3-phosphate acyltransferase PlsY